MAVSIGCSSDGCLMEETAVRVAADMYRVAAVSSEVVHVLEAEPAQEADPGGAHVAALAVVPDAAAAVVPLVAVPAAAAVLAAEAPVAAVPDANSDRQTSFRMGGSLFWIFG